MQRNAQKDLEFDILLHSVSGRQCHPWFLKIEKYAFQIFKGLSVVSLSQALNILTYRLFQCPASNAALVEQEFEPLNYGLHVTVFYPAKILFLFTIASNLWFHGNFSSACKSETTESPSKIWQAYFSIKVIVFLSKFHPLQ